LFESAVGAGEPRFDAFWDVQRLKAGKRFQDAFMVALLNSRVMTPIISLSALQRLFDLTAESDVDNVLVEHTLGVELQKQETTKLKCVYPIMVGRVATTAEGQVTIEPFEKSWPDAAGHPSPDKEKGLPQIVVRKVVELVQKFMQDHGLVPSKELHTRTVRETYCELVNKNLREIDISAFRSPNPPLCFDLRSAVQAVDVSGIADKMFTVLSKARAEDDQKAEEQSPVAAVSPSHKEAREPAEWVALREKFDALHELTYSQFCAATSSDLDGLFAEIKATFQQKCLLRQLHQGKHN
jgi:hypothetical protein